MKVINIKTDEYKRYEQKADEFFHTMELAFAERKWDSTALNGVHCMISACDALSGKYLRLRSNDIDHKSAGDLIDKMPFDDETKKTRKRQFADVLRPKNKVEYSTETFTENEADNLRKQVTRFYMWTKETLK